MKMIYEANDIGGQDKDLQAEIDFWSLAFLFLPEIQNLPADNVAHEWKPSNSLSENNQPGQFHFVNFLPKQNFLISSD